MWTHFYDMHSGGGRKASHEHIYIEAPKEEATRVFYARFGHNPNRVSCTCCGEDYSISDDETFADLTHYQRNRARWNKPEDLMTIDEYIAQDDVLVIGALEISDEERTGDDPPEEGYVWV